MDWREMAARPAVPTGSVWEKVRGAWSGGKKVGEGVEGQEQEGEGGETVAWDYGVDRRRGWIIGAAWIVASGVE